MWQQGGTWTHPLVILRARPNGSEQTRVAFVVSKKVGKAVARNRAKRLMREAARRLYPQIVQGYDIVLIGRASIAEAPLRLVDEGLEDLLRKAQLLKVSL